MFAAFRDALASVARGRLPPWGGGGSSSSRAFRMSSACRVRSRSGDPSASGPTCGVPSSSSRASLIPRARPTRSRPGDPSANGPTWGVPSSSVRWFSQSLLELHLQDGGGGEQVIAALPRRLGEIGVGKVAGSSILVCASSALIWRSRREAVPSNSCIEASRSATIVDFIVSAASRAGFLDLGFHGLHQRAKGLWSHVFCHSSKKRPRHRTDGAQPEIKSPAGSLQQGFNFTRCL